VAERIIFLGEDHLRRTIDEYLVYYHRERNHQGLTGHLIDPEKENGSLEGSIRCRQRIGGMLNYYYREVA
jgi:hypothetical protein